jgi:ectoine hydroxylase
MADQMPASTIFERDGRTVRSVFSVHDLSTYISESVIRLSRLLMVAEQILGSRVYLHQSHFNFKRPQTGGEFSWHSDFTFWYWEDGMPVPRAISMLIFLDEPRIETGPLLVAPGSHTWITHERWERQVTDHARAVMHDSVAEPGKNGLIDLDGLRALPAPGRLKRSGLSRAM